MQSRYSGRPSAVVRAPRIRAVTGRGWTRGRGAGSGAGVPRSLAIVDRGRAGGCGAQTASIARSMARFIRRKWDEIGRRIAPTWPEFCSRDPASALRDDDLEWTPPARRGRTCPLRPQSSVNRPYMLHLFLLQQSAAPSALFICLLIQKPRLIRLIRLLAAAFSTSRQHRISCITTSVHYHLPLRPQLDRLQAGRSDTQGPCNIHTILPQRSHQTSRNHTSTPFIHHAATSQTDYENTLRRPRFPMLCTLCLELVGLWNITL